MKLKETTVYVDGENLENDQPFLEEKIGYFHTKEQLTELLSSAFEAGCMFQTEYNNLCYNGEQMNETENPTEEQFIKSLFNTEE